MLAVEQGGRRLDNYDTFLGGIYRKLGFEEVNRFPWDEAQKPADWDKAVFKDFNNGEPDYLYMEYRPQGGLIDKLVDSGKLDVPTPVQAADDVDLKRFDDRLKKTADQGSVGFLPSADKNTILRSTAAAVDDPNRLQTAADALVARQVQQSGFKSSREFNDFHLAQDAELDAFLSDPDRLKRALVNDMSAVEGTGLGAGDIDDMIVTALLNNNPSTKGLLRSKAGLDGGARVRYEAQLRAMTIKELRAEINRSFDPRHGLKSVQ